MTRAQALAAVEAAVPHGFWYGHRRQIRGSIDGGPRGGDQRLGSTFLAHGSLEIEYPLSDREPQIWRVMCPDWGLDSTGPTFGVALLGICDGILRGHDRSRAAWDQLKVQPGEERCKADREGQRAQAEPRAAAREHLLLLRSAREEARPFVEGWTCSGAILVEAVPGVAQVWVLHRPAPADAPPTVRLSREQRTRLFRGVWTCAGWQDLLLDLRLVFGPLCTIRLSAQMLAEADAPAATGSGCPHPNPSWTWSVLTEGWACADCGAALGGEVPAGLKQAL